MKEAMLRELFRRIETMEVKTELDKELKEEALRVIGELLETIVTTNN